MKLLNKFRNYFVFVCPFLMFIISCTSNEDISNGIDKLNPSKIEETIDEPIDLSIKNILIYTKFIFFFPSRDLT